MLFHFKDRVATEYFEWGDISIKIEQSIRETSITFARSPCSAMHLKLDRPLSSNTNAKTLIIIYNQSPVVNLSNYLVNMYYFFARRVRAKLQMREKLYSWMFALRRLPEIWNPFQRIVDEATWLEVSHIHTRCVLCSVYPIIPLARNRNSGSRFASEGRCSWKFIIWRRLMLDRSLTTSACLRFPSTVCLWLRLRLWRLSTSCPRLRRLSLVCWCRWHSRVADRSRGLSLLLHIAGRRWYWHTCSIIGIGRSRGLGRRAARWCRCTRSVAGTTGSWTWSCSQVMRMIRVWRRRIVVARWRRRWIITSCPWWWRWRRVSKSMCMCMRMGLWLWLSLGMCRLLWRVFALFFIRTIEICCVFNDIQMST